MVNLTLNGQPKPWYFLHVFFHLLNSKCLGLSATCFLPSSQKNSCIYTINRALLSNFILTFSRFIPSLGKQIKKMKILGWMHRKFRGNEPLGDFSIGRPSLDEPYYPNSNYASKPWGKPPRELRNTNSFDELRSKYSEENIFGEDYSSAVNSELFHGFLTIGTFGSDPTATPTFSISVENIAEKEEEVTEDDLKLINEELEKVLVLGNEEDESLGRTSHASAITLSGKISGEGETNICPLQDYLFGSAIDITETAVERKEHRASLGELFQRAKVEDENRNDKNEKGGIRKQKGSDKSAIHIMKNLLKKKTEKSVESASANTKLPKILRIFHKKVYPEGSMARQKPDKISKNEMKNKFKYGKIYKNGDNFPLEGNALAFPRNSLSEDGNSCFNDRDCDGNGEFWIKTDSDYLVLEL